MHKRHSLLIIWKPSFFPWLDHLQQKAKRFHLCFINLSVEVLLFAVLPTDLLIQIPDVYILYFLCILICILTFRLTQFVFCMNFVLCFFFAIFCAMLCLLLRTTPPGFADIPVVWFENHWLCRTGWWWCFCGRPRCVFRWMRVPTKLHLGNWSQWYPLSSHRSWSSIGVVSSI